MTRIVDLLGADHAEEELLRGALESLSDDAALSLILVGSEVLTEDALRARRRFFHEKERRFLSFWRGTVVLGFAVRQESKQ